MSNLVIVESPSKAGTIKSYLGSGYKVVASVGHVRDLPKSSLGVDIENGFEAHYINIRGKGPIIKELKKDVKAADKVFLATDPDREGEAISWHLATALGIPVDETNRVTFNEVTKSAVKAGIKAPRKIDMELVNSQQARRILDRIVGYKLSPFLWKTIRGGLSAGRVQSVAVRIICDREYEIREFVPVEYWTIECTLKTDKGEDLKVKFFGDVNGKLELPNEEESAKVVAAITDKLFNIISLKKAKRQKNPSAPFTTSSLLQDASRKLGFQSQRIMRIAQELYEGVNIGSEHGGTQGLITYMRTDSLRVSDEAQTAAKEYITGKFGEQYCPPSPRVYKVDNNAQDAHEAIRPANIMVEPDAIKKYLTTDQYKLYKLIWSRFAASQMASAELDTVSIAAECSGYVFKASGYTIKFPGYLTIYDDRDPSAAESTLPEIKEGDKLGCTKIDPEKHFTKPPPRYTEASLIDFFKEKGIGRPSTYATIITTITSRGYVEREGKALKPTELGETTTSLMVEYFPDVVDCEFTAQMEGELDGIEHGKTTIQSVLSGFYDDFAAHLAKAEESVGGLEVAPEETDIVCDKCGAMMIIKNGRFGRFAACPNYPECKNTKQLTRDGKVAEPKPVEPTDLVCELCGAPMVKRAGRYGDFYACSKYPECKNTKQIMKEIGVQCPLCGGKILQKRSKRGIFYGCENDKDCEFTSWDLPTNDKCPDCGQMLYRKKGKPLMICKNKECGYKKEIEEEAQQENEE